MPRQIRWADHDKAQEMYGHLCLLRDKPVNSLDIPEAIQEIITDFIDAPFETNELRIYVQKLEETDTDISRRDKWLVQLYATWVATCF